MVEGSKVLMALWLKALWFDGIMVEGLMATYWATIDTHTNHTLYSDPVSAQTSSSQPVDYASQQSGSTGILTLTHTNHTLYLDPVSAQPSTLLTDCASLQSGSTGIQY